MSRGRGWRGGRDWTGNRWRGCRRWNRDGRGGGCGGGCCRGCLDWSRWRDHNRGGWSRGSCRDGRWASRWNWRWWHGGGLNNWRGCGRSCRGWWRCRDNRGGGNCGSCRDFWGRGRRGGSHVLNRLGGLLDRFRNRAGIWNRINRSRFSIGLRFSLWLWLCGLPIDPKPMFLVFNGFHHLDQVVIRHFLPVLTGRDVGWTADPWLSVWVLCVDRLNPLVYVNNCCIVSGISVGEIIDLALTLVIPWVPWFTPSSYCFRSHNGSVLCDIANLCQSQFLSPLELFQPGPDRHESSFLRASP